MGFARKVWHLLVGIKDGLALIFLLLFFFALYSILSVRPSPAQVQEGALLLDFNGYVVEERAAIDPLEALLLGEAPVREYQSRDLVRAIDAAASDDRIKAVVLDLDRFLGGGQVHLQDVAEALDRVRAADKPVLAYSMFYGDDAMLLASHASEVWLDPMGGAFVAGPGGSALFYKGLLDRLKVNARIYRVGTYKSAVEPYSNTGFSDAARENYESLIDVQWEEWRASVKKARPKADLARVTGEPAEWVAQSKGNLAQAALAAGLVDKIGDRIAFGNRVAEIAGEDRWDDLPGTYAYTELDPWLEANPAPGKGSAIGVVTIAGEIVDGDAGPGTAGGARIAQLLDEALVDEDLKGLVVRVDSPGGTTTASEEIRQAILRHKARKIPIAVSMANVAASGGYWVATSGDRIFAEPQTFTGSIGIFAVIPTFERTAAEIGITTDSIRTSPLSGQPSLIAGLTPAMDAILQASIENGYSEFLERVSQSRKISPAAVDRIGQGRVWDGGTARQIGLVDQYGGLDEALAWVASQAKLPDGKWHPLFLGANDDGYDSLLRTLLMGEEDAATGRDLFARIARQQQLLGGQMASDLERLFDARGVQAFCLECPQQPRLRPVSRSGSIWAAILERFTGA